jgi:MarR family transcriptional regulator for hemolysin
MNSEQAITAIEEAWQTTLRRARLPVLAERVDRYSGVSISTNVYRLLGDLAAQGPTRISDLATGAGVDVSTMSRTIRQLEEKGLVDRRSGEDRRAAVIELTTQGLWTLRKVKAARRRTLREALAGWEERDRQELGRLLLMLTDAVLDYASRPDPMTEDPALTGAAVPSWRPDTDEMEKEA